MAESTRYRLDTLGTLAFAGPHTEVRAADQRQQRRRLALLATLACTRERGLSRDQLMLLFWPDSPQAKARHSLDQLLYAVRRTIDDALFIGVNPLRLNDEVISSDVGDFMQACRDGQHAHAVELYGGPFLDGFYLRETREFEEWVAVQRERLAHSYSDALSSLVHTAEASGDTRAAVSWQRKLVETDPVSTRHALELMRLLARSGDTALAIAHGEQYRQSYAKEFGGSIASIDQRLAELRRADVEVPAPRHVAPSIVEAGGTPTIVTETPLTLAPRLPERRVSGATWARGIAVLLGAAVLVAVALSAINTPAPVARHNSVPTRNVAAFDLYQRATDPALLRNDSMAMLALGYLARAVQLDSTFAAGYAALATMYQRMAMSNTSTLSLSEIERLARGAAERAIALDAQSAEAHETLGLIESFWGTDLSRAKRELQRAIALDSTLLHAREYLAMTQLSLGETGDAMAQARLGAAEHPLSPTARATVAQLMYVNGECDAALRTLDSLSTLTPPLLRVANTRALCFADGGRWAEAVSAVRPQATRHPDLRTLGVLGFSLAKSGARGEAAALLAQLQRSAARTPWAHYYAAMVAYGLGDTDGAAVEWRLAAGSTVVPFELLGAPFSELRARVRYVASR